MAELKSGSNFCVCGKIPLVWPFKWNLMGSFSCCFGFIKIELVNLLNIEFESFWESELHKRLWVEPLHLQGFTVKRDADN